MTPFLARPPGMADHLMAIGTRYTKLPQRDQRSDEEILGYDNMPAGK